MSSSPISPTDPDEESPSTLPDEPVKRMGRRRLTSANGAEGTGLRAERLGGMRRRKRQLDAEVEAEEDDTPAPADPIEDPAEAEAETAAAEDSPDEQPHLRRSLGLRAARRVTAATKFSAETLAQVASNAGPVAGEARLRPRHRLVMLSFMLVVVLPLLLSAGYLWAIAKDQYASTVGFSVRREDASAAADILGGLTSLTKSSSSDTDILYEYLRSQKLVADMDAKVDLRGLWSKPFGDPVFTFDADGSIEDLVDYWQRMVRTSYDPGLFTEPCSAGVDWRFRGPRRPLSGALSWVWRWLAE